MKTLDLETDIKRLLASTKVRDEFDKVQRQLSCRVSVVCHYQIGALAEKVNMTRTALAERLLEQATSIAWEAAGLGELTDADIDVIKAQGKDAEGQKNVNTNGRGLTTSDPEHFSRINCIGVAFRHLGLEVGKAKNSGAVAVSNDGSTRICCLTSKDYEFAKRTPDGERYWFTIYERHLENIQRAKQSYIVLGCGSTKQIVMVPAHKFSAWCGDLPPYTQGLTGWHIHLWKVSGKWELRREGRGKAPIDMTNYVI